jgi:acetolactate synthase-1/3 small subunit
MKRTIAVLVNNSAGVLTRLSGLFARRSYNIDSLTVGTTEDPTVSRMTIVVHGDEHVSEQIMKQLHKQIDVLKVSDLTDDKIIARELVLIRINANHQTRPEINHLVVPFRASIVDVGKDSVTIQATGDADKIEALIELLKPYGIKEMARTGLTALARSKFN